MHGFIINIIVLEYVLIKKNDLCMVNLTAFSCSSILLAQDGGSQTGGPQFYDIS